MNEIQSSMKDRNSLLVELIKNYNEHHREMIGIVRASNSLMQSMMEMMKCKIDDNESENDSEDELTDSLKEGNSLKMNRVGTSFIPYSA